MKKHEDFLENALVAAGLKKLPKAIKNDVAYDGIAIVKIKKVGGKEYYGIGTWNSDLKRSNIARDFDTKPEEKVVGTYPVGRVAKTETSEEMEARIRKEMETKFELEKLEVEVPEGAKLPELTALLNEKRAELSDGDLEKAKEFLVGLGYSDVYTNKLTLEAATKSVEKMKGFQTAVTSWGETPEANKDELEKQFKRLEKANK